MADEKPANHDALLERVRKRFSYSQNQWREIREEARTDMRFVAGDPWTPKDRQAREDAGRPCVSLDELGQYFNQVINEVRANPRGMKFEPTGNGANDKTAEFYGNKAREIEYRSHAADVYITALENALYRSYGFVRLTKKFGKKSFNQELWLEAFPNPDLVLPDPDAQSPSGADMQYCFVYEPWDVEDFKLAYPDAKITDFSSYLAQFPDWVKAEKILLAEYWELTMVSKTLLLLQGPDGRTAQFYQDELGQMPDGWVVAQKREEEVPQVIQYLTNGVEILKVTPWDGSYIPIASCYGKVLWVDDGAGPRKKLLSMTRLAREPYMAYCFYRTCELENVGLTTKNPYWAYRGQMNAKEKQEVAKSMHEPVAVLEAGAHADGEISGELLPLPRRNVDEAQIQALSVGAEEMRRAIQAAMGSNFLPTQAQRKNEKSGIALQQIEQTAQKGTFHFVNHYEDMIRHLGVMIEDLIPKVHDTAGETGIMKANGTADSQRINTPNDPESVSTEGTHLVTISTGPSFETEREAASDFADTLAQNPQVFPLIGPLVVKLKNLGPIGDEIAKALEVLQPPELRQQKDGQQPPLPPEIQKRLAELDKFAQVATQRIHEMTWEKQAKLLELQNAREIAELNNATKLRVGEMTAKVESAMQTAELFAQRMELLLTHAHDVGTQGADQAHELMMAQQGHDQAMEQQQAGVEGQAQLSDQGHQHALEQQEAQPEAAE